jgi:membrane dipeptidase
LIIVDNLQYANWSEKIFREMRTGGVSAVHVTIAYHENFREAVLNLEKWNVWFERFPHLIMKGKKSEDITLAQKLNKTAIFFGFQNPSPIEDDIGLLEVFYQLGVRFMQLSYNNQSLLATGCYENEDAGLTRFGTQAVKEMNRLGMVIDMSHSGERSTLEAIQYSDRPIAITHANPYNWHSALRNKSHKVLKELTSANGMLGFSLYPHHLREGTDCSLRSFCEMISEVATAYGAEHLGIGSDLCQDQPDSIVTWMRTGRWSKEIDYGEGSAENPGFPAQPDWFKDNTDFGNLTQGLSKVGFSSTEVKGIMGKNWLEFYKNSFGESKNE